jgi:hypothetical protein
MKQILSIFSILIVCSCGINDFQKKLTECNQAFEENIQIIDLESNKIYKSFEREMRNDFWGNPVKTKPWYEKTVKVKNLVGICDKTITNIQAKLKESPDKNIKIEDYEIDKLKLCVDSLEKCILSQVDARNEGLKNEIRKTLNCKNWPTSLSEKGLVIEKQVVIEKIRLDVKMAELYILLYLHTKIDYACFRFNKIESVVIPKSEIVPSGYPYEADIILGTVDSTATFEYEIDDKKYIANEYKYIYKEKVTAKEGVVTRPGRFALPHRYTLDSLLIPFTIEYEVIK